MERLFSTVCYFLSHFCWSVNYMSRVSKFHIFFWHAQKLRQGVYLRDFSIAIYGNFNSNFPVLFLAFFHLVCKFLKSLFSPFLLVSKLYELNLWFQRYLDGYLWIYIWELLILLFIKSLTCTICAYSGFFLVCKLYNSRL